MEECNSACCHSRAHAQSDAMVPHALAFTPAYATVPTGTYVHSPVHGQSLPYYIQPNNPAALAQQVC